MPLLPVFLTREASSSSSTSTSTSTSTTSHSDTMLAVPILHHAANQASPAKKDQQQQGQQPQSHPGAQLTDSIKHKPSKFNFPSISGSTSPPPPSPASLLFPNQHPSVSTLNLQSASPRIPHLHLPPSKIHSLPSPPSHSPHRPQPYASSSLQTASSLLSQDSLSDSSMSTKPSLDSNDQSFRFRGPLGHPLWGLPVGAASEGRQPVPSIATHPPSSFAMSMSGRRHKLRTSLSPLRMGLPEGDDFTDLEDRRMRSGSMYSSLRTPRSSNPWRLVLSPRSRPQGRGANYSPANLSVLNVHGGLDMSRRRHHPFRPDSVPYPRNYERTILDL